MKKKVINLTEKQKIKYCESLKICKDCILDTDPSGWQCLKNINIKKDIAFYKKYIAKLEKIGNREVEI